MNKSPNKEKVLILHNKYSIQGGEDIVANNEYKLLKYFGHEVEFFTTSNDINNIFTKLLFPVLIFINPIKALQLNKVINKFKPDIIITHNFFAQFSPFIYWVARYHGITLVQTIHNFRFFCANGLMLRDNKFCDECHGKKFPLKGLMSKCYQKSFFKTLLVFLVYRIHSFIGTFALSNIRYIFLTSQIKKKYTSSVININNNLHVKPNFTYDRGWQQKKHNYFLFMGRLSEEKGITLLLNAFSHLKHNIVIIGDGPLKKNVISSCEANKNIKYLGKKNNADVIEILKKAKALIVPSIWHEVMPMTIIEAFACGCPVLASNFGSMKSMVKEDYNGYLFNMNNKKSLINCVNKYEKNFSNEMIINARKTFTEHYSRQKQYKALIKIIKQK